MSRRWRSISTCVSPKPTTLRCVDLRSPHEAPATRRLSGLTVKASSLRDPQAARAACERLRSTAGIESAHIHTFHGHALVHFDESRIDADRVRALVRGAVPREPLGTALLIPWLKWLPSVTKLAFACVG